MKSKYFTVKNSIKTVKNYFKFILYFIYECSHFIFKYVYNNLSLIYHNLKNHLFLFIKLACLCLMIFNGLLLTIDYFSYKYVFNLDVKDNDHDNLFPTIHICTEKKIKFDKQKVNNYFDTKQQYESHESNLKKIFTKKYNDLEEITLRLDGKMGIVKTLQIQQNVQIEEFLNSIMTIIENQLDEDELKSLLMRAQDLFATSSSLISKNKSIHSYPHRFFHKYENMLDNDFGLCFEINRNNNNKEKFEYLKTIFNKSKLNNFIINSYNSTDPRYNNLYLNETFIFYYFILNENDIIYPFKEQAVKIQNLDFDWELYFSKNTYKYLSTPYMEHCTNRESYFKQTRMKCFYDCVKNNFKVEENVNFSDLKKNSNENNCKKKCIQLCQQTKYKMEIRKINNIDENWNILIKRSKKIEFSYIAEPKYEFHQFITDLGCLFGIYLGIAFLDISEYLEKVLLIFEKDIQLFKRKFRAFLRRYKKLNKILNFIFQFIESMIQINWRNILKIISLPVLIFIIIYLIYTYVKYQTLIRYEFIKYRKTNNKIWIGEYPSITVCTQNRFKQLYKYLSTESKKSKYTSN